MLDPGDTVASVRAPCVVACETSTAAVAGMGPDDVLPGNRRSPLPPRRVMLPMIREPAQHCGHADILREQVPAGRPS